MYQVPPLLLPPPVDLHTDGFMCFQRVFDTRVSYLCEFLFSLGSRCFIFLLQYKCKYLNCFGASRCSLERCEEVLLEAAEVLVVSG